MKTLDPTQTQAGAPPVKTGTRTLTVVCEECDTPKDFTREKALNWAVLPEPEKTCRVCGLSYPRCPVGGM